MSYTYKEKGHVHLFDGKRMNGVTTILNVIAKPALISWAANMAVDYVKDHIIENELIIYATDRWDEMLAEARVAHTKKKEAGGDVGHNVHEAIENWVKDGKEPELTEQEMTMFGNFKKWVAENKVKFIENEKHLYSEKLFVGGICDAIVEIDGQKWIADWKTGGTRLYPEAFWQCGAYDILLNEMGEHKDITGYLVLGIFKDGTTEEKRSVSNEDHKKAFLAAYDIYKIKQKIESQIL